MLLDYGHNAPAILALGDFIRKLKAKEVVCVLGLPGDRRNQDLQDAARAAAQFCHHVIIREDNDLRGRQPGEMAELIRQALRSEGVDASRLQIIPDEGQAVHQAILEAVPKSLVVVLYERYAIVKDAVRQAGAIRMKSLALARDRA